ncbi:MAG: hypothetical protein HN922_05585 [Anaerolineae bacterium]|nr:hypothetical protein [Anaerolineae bacterium]
MSYFLCPFFHFHLRRNNKEEAILEDKKNFTVGVISARGGIGVSSVALNLGSFLSTNMGEDTIVVELIQGMGTMGRDLGLENFGAITELFDQTPKKLSEEDVEKALFEHETGVRLLPASENPRDAILNDDLLQSKSIFLHLNALSSFLVVDFGSGLPSLSQSLLKQCDQILIVIDAFSNSIAQSKILVENLIELDIEKEKILIILNNRIRSELLLGRSQVEKKIGAPIVTAFTPAPELYSQATRKKTTAIIEDPKSLTTQQFQKLAKTIVENEAEEK